MTVLFVDDDEPVRMTFAALLEESGLRLVEAGSLAEARSVLRREQYRLVVLDYNLPDGKGTELLPEIATLSPRPRVAMFTGTELQSVAADTVLLKSSSPEALIERLTQLATATPLPIP